jgi:tetratricopeptide (TPR) repeat protein
MPEKAEQRDHEYARELRSMDAFNPHQNDEEYLKVLKTYLDKIDAEVKNGNMDVFSEMAAELNEKTRDKGGLLWKWIFYDVAKYFMFVDKDNIAMNHTAYDPFPFSILASELKRQGQYDLVREVLLSIVTHEIKNYISLEQQLLNDPSKRGTETFMQVYEKTRMSCGRVLSDITHADIKLKKYGEALEAVEKIILLHPQDVYAYGLKARALIGLGRFDETLEAVEKIILLHPQDVYAYGLRAQALIGLRRFDEALEVIETKVLQGPRDVYAHSLKAQALIGLRRFDEALEAANTLISIDHSNQFAHGLKAQALIALREYEQALEVVKTKVLLDPQDVYAYGLRARALIGLGRFDKALEAANTLISIDPDSVFAYSSRARALIGLGRFDETLEAVEKIILLHPQDVYAYGLRAQALIGLRRFDEALKAAEEEILRDPDNKIARGLQAQALIGLGGSENIENAEGILSKLDDNIESVLWLKSKCYAILGRLQDAKKMLIVLSSKSYTEGHVKESYVEAFLSIINRRGYTMSDQEVTIVQKLRAYFGELTFERLLSNSKTYDWSTPVQDDEDDLNTSRAFRNPVYDGTFTSAAEGGAGKATGAPVHMKKQIPEKRPVVVKVKKRRTVTKK